MRRMLLVVMAGNLVGLGGTVGPAWSQFEPPRVPAPHLPGPGVTVIVPPRLVGMIEFLDPGTELNQWRVRLSGREYLVKVNEHCEREVRALYPGLVTPLYENMTFRNAHDRECAVIFSGR